MNPLNQITCRTVPGYVNVLGTATNTATVSLWSKQSTALYTSSTRKGDYFRGELPFNSPLWEFGPVGFRSSNTPLPAWRSPRHDAVVGNWSGETIGANGVRDQNRQWSRRGMAGGVCGAASQPVVFMPGAYTPPAGN